MRRREVLLTALSCVLLPILWQVWALNKVTNYNFNGNATGWTATNGTGTDTCGSTTTTAQTAFATFAYSGGAWQAISGTGANARYKGYISQQVTIPGSGSTQVLGKFYYTGTATTWRASNADGYIRIDLYDSGNTTFVANLACQQLPGSNVAGTTVTGTAVGVTPGTYTLRATLAYRNSTTNAATLTIDNIMVNSAPVGLTASAVAGTTSASLSWTASTTVSGPSLRATNPYQVYRGTTSGGEAALAFASTNSYTDASTTGNTTYYFQVTDLDVGVDGTQGNADDNQSPVSAEVSVLTCPGTPGTPTFTGVTQTNITVNWTAPTGGAASYKVERAPDVSGAPGTWSQVDSGVTSPWSDSTVSCGTTYWYRVRGTNASGDGAYSGQASQAASACANNTTAGTVTASASGCSSITVSAPYSGDADGDNSLTYRTRTPSGSGAWSASTPVSHSASPYGFTISSLTHGATYDVEVTFVDGDGVSGTNPQTVSNILVGANCTGAGTATAAQTAGATPSIAVSAPYTFDNDGDNTLSYRFRLTSGSYGAPVALGHSASPYTFTISGLACGSSYDVEVTYADPDGVGSGTAVQTISGIPVTNCTAAGSPSATVDACNQITVSAPFSNDANGNGTTNFERGPAAAGPWTAVCTGKTGASPRTCVDSGVSASSSYYYRVTFADADGVSGTAQQVIGPYATPPCATLPVTPGTPTATVDSCTQISASAPYTGDTNGNSSTTFSVGPGPTGPWTAKCSGVTGASPRSCALSGLTQNTAYYIQVDFADGDGVGGTDPQVIGPFTTLDCRVAPLAASATVNTCNRVTVSAPFSGDANANSSTTVRRGTAPGGPFNDTICSGLTGATPRSCVDSTAQGATTYYYQVAFADADGVNGSATQVVGPMLTPACSDPKTTPGALTLTPATCDSIIASAAFTGDGDGDGTTRFEFNTSNSWPGTVACAAVAGSSPRQCTVQGLTPGTTYWVRAVFSDPDGLGGADPSPASAVTPSPCGADKVAPTVLFQSPARNAVVGGLERVKVQVYDAGGLAGLTVQWKVDDGTFAAAAANANYACGTDCAVYEFDVNTTAGLIGSVAPLSLFNANHTVWLQAQDAAGNRTLVGLPVTVNNVGGSPATAGTAAAGNGLLLRRTHGSETCLDCHNLKSHTSQETSTKYGSWAVDCLSCHTPHKTTNIHLVKNQLETPNSGIKTPVFRADDKAGGTNPQNSYLGAYDAGGAPYDDGICEVCHTKTNHYRNDASGGDHTHSQNQRCLGCHKHTEGFRGAGCDGCHGNPPVAATLGGPSGLVDSEGGTGSVSPGAHAAHATGGTNYSYPCVSCHTGGMPSSPIYDKNLQLGFDLFTGAYTGGSYDGRAALANGYGYQAGNASTAITQGGTMQCANLYCHGSTMDSAGDRNGGTNITPRWDSPATGACGTCHGATAAMPPQRGMHFRHAGPVTDVGHQYACALCHTDPSVDKSNHVNNLSEVSFSSDPKVSGGSYSGTPAMMDAYGNCSNIYCHSNVQTSPPGGPLTYSPPASANWGSDVTYTCDPCHSGPADHFSNPQGGQTSGSHPKHNGLYCSDCHALNRTVARADCGACHTATGPNEFHGDYSVDVNILTAFGGTASYSGTPAPGDAYGSCSNVYCHGTGTPQWGSTLNCSGCHKANNTLANSHSKHYESATVATGTTATFGSTEAGYLYGCGYCHPSGTANHAQGAVSGVQAAQVAFSGTLPGGQAVSGSYAAGGTAAGTDSGFSYTAGTCSNMYCHSNAAPLSGTDSKRSVTWTSTVTCASCHNTAARGDTAVATDLSAAHGKHIQSTSGETGSYAYTCNACHAGVIKDGPANPWALTAADFNTAAGKGKQLHVQGQHSVGFSGTLLGVNQSAGTYSGAGYTCGSIYCHSDGTTTTAPFGSTTSIAWNATADAECDSCHGGNSTSTAATGKGPLATASHPKHISGPWTLSCTVCHNTVVSADRTVSSKSLHVNGAKNVSMGTGSWTSPTCSATGTGCHGAGTPTWGGTVYCINCHGAAADSPNWSATDGVMSQINTTEWAYSGHGKASGTYDVTGNSAANFAAGGANPCLYCHDDVVNHKVTTNPFRLRSSATTNQVCLNCHATGSAGVQPTGYTLLNGVSKVNAYHYPASGGKHGAGNNGGKFCWDCHDPHGDRISGSGNVAMIGASVAKQSDGTYGIPTTQVTPTFTANATGTDFAKSSAPYSGICNVCHATTGHYTASAGDSHNSTKKCDQSGCHTHDQGTDRAFFAGESNGDDDCLGCHSMGMVITESSRTSAYHHVVETANKTSAGITVYPTAAAPTASTADLDKNCTQCHADHNVFRPDVNTGNTLGRGANLRTRIASGPPTAAKGTNLNAAPGDVAGSYFSDRDADGSFPSGGICLSCHTAAQTKNVADQKTYTGDPGSTAAIVSAAGNFSVSAHGFTVAGAITNGSSAFTVACTKCHGENTTAYQSGTYKFDMHTSANRRLLQTLGITSPADPLEENFCFRCHSRTTDTTPGGGPVKGTANRDYYNQAAMSAQSEKVFSQFSTAGSYPWDHPVQGTGGLHDPVEGTAADDGTIGGTSRHIQCEDCHNPHASAPIASGIYTGSVTGYTTAADPTPDTLTDSSKAWTVNAMKGLTVKMTTGAQAGKYSVIYANTATALSVNFGTAPVATDKYIIVNWGFTSTSGTLAGNLVSPAMNDVWGVAPTWPTQPAPPNWNDSAGTATAAEIAGQYTAISTWNRTASATSQGQICIKCHSAYAYGTSPPNTPSGAGNSTTTTWSNTAGTATAQSDIANQFNPNNLAHHAVFARGKNQPLVSSDTVTSTYNPNWPKYTTGTVAATNGSAAVTLTGGTWPVTILPGWFIYIGNAAPAQATAGWYEVAAVGSTTTLTLDRNYTGATGAGKAFMLTAGLGNNFVPPYGPWSTLSCTDCHSSSVQSDPLGPHGSAIKWLLKGGEPQNFLFYNGTSVVTVTYTPDTYNVCMNCHRRDVYGDYTITGPAFANYARQSHPIDAGKDHSIDYRSSWGIVCMNCHGGARIGQIHGSNLGKGFNGTGGSYSGKRLLAGSSWYAVTRGTTTTAGACWTKGSTDAVDTCGHTHSNVGFLSGNANYNYDTNP